MSFISSRIGPVSNRFIIRKHIRCFVNTPCLQAKEEILSENRLKELVAQLEKPLNVEDNTTILLQEIESLRPQNNLLHQKEYETLENRLGKSYNKKQLAEYLASKDIYRFSKITKKNMLEIILQNSWKLRTVEQVKEEKRRKVIQQFPATRQELFFIIGDNGNTIRNIERKNQVNITIDVSKFQYLVEGQPAAVENAKHDIISHLNIIESHVQIPKEVVDNDYLKYEVSRILTDISKSSGSYISLDDDKFVFSSLSNNSMENAKRLLNLTMTDLNITHKKSLDQADTTLVKNGSEYSLIPFHDARALSVYNRQFGWSRLQKKDVENDEDDFTDLASQKKISLNDIKDALFNGFDETDRENISLEARFGHLIYLNSTDSKMSPNLLQPISTSSLVPSEIANLDKNNKSRFFNSTPPFQLLSSLSSSALEKNFYQRIIKVEYVNNSLLANNSQLDNSGLKRLQVEFNVKEDGDMTLSSIIGEKKRSVIDILGISGQLDARIIAKHFVKYSKQDMQELIEKCNLLGYTELKAPIHYTDMTLLDISYINRKRFLSDDNLIHLDSIEEQDSKSKRIELQVTSVDSEKLDIFNSIERWNSFSNNLINISSKWKL